MSLTLEILTPTKIIMTGAVDEVHIPGVLGEVEVLPQHTSYASLLGLGRVVYRQGTQSTTVNITGGVVTVDNDRVTLLVDKVVDDLQ